MAASFYVISFCLFDEKCVFETIEIFADGYIVGVHLRFGVHRVADFARIRKSANAAHDNVQQGLQYRRILYGIAFDYVPEIDCTVKIVEV